MRRQTDVDDLNNFYELRSCPVLRVCTSSRLRTLLPGPDSQPDERTGATLCGYRWPLESVHVVVFACTCTTPSKAATIIHEEAGVARIESRLHGTSITIRLLAR